MPLSECTRACASINRVFPAIESLAPSSYVVGGFVRDCLLDRPSRDIDIVVFEDPFQIAQRLATTLNGSFVSLDDEHGIARIVLPQMTDSGHNAQQSDAERSVIDVAHCQGPIEDDLARRDFTLDAIAVPVSVIAAHISNDGRCPPATILDNAIDPHGGLRDLSDRILRHCGSEAFREDPGRLLRAVRLAQEFALTIAPDTESLIARDAPLVATVAAERTREELLKLMDLPCSGDSVRYLDRVGLLTHVIPELEHCRDVAQPTSHFWDVLEHSIQTMSTFEFISGQADWRFGNDEMLDYMPAETAFHAYLAEEVSAGATRAALIKLGCLLHDIAKPQTRELDDTGRARFLGHAKDGAATAKDILQRLRFSTNETAYVETLIYNHLRPAQMSTEGPPTARAVYRFFRDTGNAGAGVLYVAMADYLACRGPLFTMSEWCSVCDLVTFILQEHQRQRAAITPRRLLDGRELMHELNLESGPTVGRLLEMIIEAQAAGQVTTKDEALRLARDVIRGEHLSTRTST